MKNKTTTFYSPKLSEISLGYQLEVKSENCWVKRTIDTFHQLISIGEGSTEIRTPHLSNEDLINEGWFEENKYTNYSGVFVKSRYILNLYTENDNPSITIYDNRDDVQLFQGKCMSVNEFRKIITFINI